MSIRTKKLIECQPNLIIEVLPTKLAFFRFKKSILLYFLAFPFLNYFKRHSQTNSKMTRKQTNETDTNKIVTKTVDKS